MIPSRRSKSSAGHHLSPNEAHLWRHLPRLVHLPNRDLSTKSTGYPHKNVSYPHFRGFSWTPIRTGLLRLPVPPAERKGKKKRPSSGWPLCIFIKKANNQDLSLSPFSGSSRSSVLMKFLKIDSESSLGSGSDGSGSLAAKLDSCADCSSSSK